MVHTPLKPLPRFIPGVNPSKSWFTPAKSGFVPRNHTSLRGENTPAMNVFFGSFLDWIRQSPLPNSCKIGFFTPSEPEKGSFGLTLFRVQLGCNSHRQAIQSTPNGLWSPKYAPQCPLLSKRCICLPIVQLECPCSLRLIFALWL